MNDNVLTYGISIYVEDSGNTYHTLDDWGLALGNNNYIGDPQMETTYIAVPGRDGLIDASEAISGRRVYRKRSLAFELGGMRDRLEWDGVISSMRNTPGGSTPTPRTTTCPPRSSASGWACGRRVCSGSS